MTPTTRPCAGEPDWSLITDLIRAAPPKSRHLVNYPWRLSSPSGQSQRDCRLWLGDDGTAVGLACWQTPWAALDFYARPGPLERDVEEAIFAWAARRFRRARRRARPPVAVLGGGAGGRCRPARAAREARVFARRGLLLRTAMQRPLAEPAGCAELPPGFSIRTLLGEGEVEAYVALHRRAFDSATMTAPWRARTLRWPQYRPEIDLVAVAPDGRLAGFCVGWLDAERRVAQIEPFGVDPD